MKVTVEARAAWFGVGREVDCREITEKTDAGSFRPLGIADCRGVIE